MVDTWVVYKKHFPIALFALLLTVILAYLDVDFVQKAKMPFWACVYLLAIFVLRPVKELRTLKFDGNELIKPKPNTVSAPMYWTVHFLMLVAAITAFFVAQQ